MTNQKTNINGQIEKLFNLYQSAEVTNKNITATAFDSAITNLGADYITNKLTEEELTVSNVSIQRIELQRDINDNITFTRSMIKGFSPREEVPEWVIKNSTDEENFEIFFSNLQNISE